MVVPVSRFLACGRLREDCHEFKTILGHLRPWAGAEGGKEVAQFKAIEGAEPTFQSPHSDKKQLSYKARRAAESQRSCLKT